MNIPLVVPFICSHAYIDGISSQSFPLVPNLHNHTNTVPLFHSLDQLLEKSAIVIFAHLQKSVDISVKSRCFQPEMRAFLLCMHLHPSLENWSNNSVCSKMLLNPE